MERMRVDVQAPKQRQDVRMIMDVVQVIQDDEEALARVAGSRVRRKQSIPAGWQQPRERTDGYWY